MPHTKVVALVIVLLLLSACTEAKRFLDDKAETKAKPTPRASGSDSALNPSPSVSSSSKPAAAAAAVFSGDIAGKAGKRLLYQLLEKNDRKPVKLDVLLSDEQLTQLHDVTNGQKWYFDLAYEGQDGFNTGGELLIDIAKGKGDLKLAGNHLTGSIVVTNWTGPHQGLMSISAKPASASASNEATSSSRSETPKSATPTPAEKKKKPTPASNPPI
ncbi:MAG TPA: hypothetical protein VFZ34_05380 [Blastocatellia bacterium]|nr:hypothetical protein [Blastocatellia bacterium]